MNIITLTMDLSIDRPHDISNVEVSHHDMNDILTHTKQGVPHEYWPVNFHLFTNSWLT